MRTYNNDSYDHVNRFISYHYQIEAIRNIKKKNILEIGKGNGLVSDYLTKIGLKITTCDISKDLKPDIISSVTDLKIPDKSYDCVVAYQVLEHIPFDDFEKALLEMKRVSKDYVIISIPSPSLYFGFFFGFQKPLFDFALRFPLFFINRKLVKKVNFSKKKNIFSKLYNLLQKLKTSTEHYWEMRMKGYPKRKIMKVLKKHFKIVDDYQPNYVLYHHYFILKKK